MLVTNKELLKRALDEKYAVGAFNVYNLESILSIVEAAEEERSPVIIAITPKSIEHAGLEHIANLAKSAAEKSSVEVSVHLDHGKDLEIVERCIASGFTSVMFDGSYLNIEENIRLTKRAVEMAHAKGVSAEGEVGILDRKKQKLTNPEDAKNFVEKTGVDALAVSIGTSHGAYKFKGKPELDLKRLEEIRNAVNVPLVLHGASTVPSTLVKKANKFGAKLHDTSGLPESQIKKAISLGITKINIDTDLRIAFVAAVREHLARKPKSYDPREMLYAAKECMKDVVKSRMRLFGSSNKSRCKK